MGHCVQGEPTECVARLGANPWNNELNRYELIRRNHLKPEKDFANFFPVHNVWVTARDGVGNATHGWIQVLSDNPANSITVLSAANDWGKSLKPEDYLKSVDGGPYFLGEVRGLHHGMEYRLQVNGKQLIDPASTVYTQGPHLNSVFWDFERPGAYKQWRAPVDTRGRYNVIAEGVLREFVRQWNGGPATSADTYKFIADSGVIGKLKEMGYNAVEFLPFNTAVDGDEWHLRYQVYGQYGPDLRDGTPDDFAYMIDKFHEAGMAVVMDAVVGHYPDRGNAGSRSLGDIGLHQWKKGDGRSLYGERRSPWDTRRYDFANKYVRRFLVEGVLNHFKRYRIDGVRVDNLDGIRFYEEGGGEDFIRELATSIRQYRPDALLIGEMFFGEQRVLQRLDWFGGMGFDVRSHSAFFDFYKDNWLKFTEAINMEQLRSAIRDPWNWGELMRFLYATNHDEAGNGRDGATGSYPATLLQGGGWHYVEKKTMAWGALGMLAGSQYLDLPQMRILQEGNFGKNPQVEWWLLREASQRKSMESFASLSRLVQEKPHFLAENLHPHVENHVDYDNKIISLLRIDHKTGKRIYALINLGHKEIHNYRFGVDTWTNGFNVIFSSEYPFAAKWLDKHHHSSHDKPHSVVVPHLRPFEVLVIEEP